MTLENRRAVWQNPLANTVSVERSVSNEKEFLAAITDFIKQNAKDRGLVRKIKVTQPIVFSKTISFPQSIGSVEIDFQGNQISRLPTVSAFACFDVLCERLTCKHIRFKSEASIFTYLFTTSGGSVIPQIFVEDLVTPVGYNTCSVALCSSSVSNLFIEKSYVAFAITNNPTSLTLTMRDCNGATAIAQGTGSIYLYMYNCLGGSTITVDEAHIHSSSFEELTVNSPYSEVVGCFTNTITCNAADCVFQGNYIDSTVGAVLAGERCVFQGNIFSGGMAALLSVTGGYCAIVGNIMAGLEITTNTGTGHNTVIGNVSCGTLTTAGTDQVANNT